MSGSLQVVDGLKLSDKHRELLKPGEMIADAEGRTHKLPRFFYKVDSWAHAKETKLTAHFTMAELMSVDCREAPLLLHEFPHYIPCAVSVLARYLEEFRSRVEGAVCIAVNGGYRSPAHRYAETANPHLWGTAADIFRIGDQFADSQKNIEKYARIAESIGQEVFTFPYGHGAGATDDHLHLDIGYLCVAPRGLSE